MLMKASMNCKAQLSAVLNKADGSKVDVGILATDDFTQQFNLLQKIRKTLSRMIGPAAAAILLAHMVKTAQLSPLALPMMGLVTDAGLNFLAVAFTVDAAGTDIFNMKFHDSGTGTTAAAQTDTTLQTQAGPTTRATGTNTQTQSASGTGSTTPAIVQSVGTIAYVSTLAITEWGLFSQAAQGGTMWDHRIFSAINVVSGDSIQFTYSLSIPGGGT
jgi:hypothetical protein